VIKDARLDEDGGKKDQSYIDRIISGSEVLLTINEIEIELLTERHLKKASKFFFTMRGIEFKKLVKTSESVLYKFEAQVKEFFCEFSNMNQNYREKLMALIRIKDPKTPIQLKQVLNASIDVLPEQDTLKLSVSLCLASLQATATIDSLLGLMKLMKKLSEFQARHKVLMEGLLEYMCDASQSKPVDNPDQQGFNDNDNDIDDVLVSFIAEKKDKNREKISLTQSFTQSMLGNQMHDAALISEDEATTAKELLLDVSIHFQGVLFALLKEAVIGMGDLNYWCEEKTRNGMTCFETLFISHFLLRVEQVCLELKKSEPKKMKANVTVGRIQLEDWNLDEVGQRNALTDNSFCQRVILQGMDQSVYILNDDSILESQVIDSSQSNMMSFAPGPEHTVTTLVRFQAFPDITEPTVITATILVEDKLEVQARLGVINVEINLNTLVLLNNPNEFSQVFDKLSGLLGSEQKINQTEGFRHKEKSILYGSSTQNDLLEQERQLNKLKASAQKSGVAERLRDVLKIQNPENIPFSQIPQFSVDFLGVSISLNGSLDETVQKEKNRKASLVISTGEMSLKIKEKILFYINQNVGFMIQTLDRNKEFASIIVGREKSVLGLDKEVTFFKIPCIELTASPEVIEDAMLFIQILDLSAKRMTDDIVSSGMTRALNRFVKSEAEAYYFFPEELRITEKAIELLRFLSTPAISKKVFFFWIYKILVAVNDEDTIEKIKASEISKRKVFTEDPEVDEWTVLNDETEATRTQRRAIPLKEHYEEQCKMREQMLNLLNVILNLELNHIMFKYSVFSPVEQEMEALCSNLRVMDTLTIGEFRKNPQSYETYFFELTSATKPKPFSEPRQDRFSMNDAVEMFKREFANYKSDAWVYVIMPTKTFTMETDLDEDLIQVIVSKMVYRLAMNTADRTFNLMIEVLDKILYKLENLTNTVLEIKEREMKARKRRESTPSQLLTMPIEEPPKKSSSLKLAIKLGGVYLDLYKADNYRWVTFLEHISVDMSIKESTSVQVSLSTIESVITNNSEAQKKRTIDKLNKTQGFFKIFKIKDVSIYFKSTVEDLNPLTKIYISLPTQKKPSVKVKIDIENISYILGASNFLTKILNSASKKCKSLFRTTSISRTVSPPEKPTQEYDFEVVKSFEEEREFFEQQSKLRNSQESIKQRQSIDEEVLRKYDPLAHDKEKSSLLMVHLEIPTISINIYQKFEVEKLSTSYISLQLRELELALLSRSFMTEEEKPYVHKATTLMTLSLQGLALQDKTKNSKFEHLLRLKDPALRVYYRSVDRRTRVLNPTVSIVNGYRVDNFEGTNLLNRLF
jgi:hypothetical protein